MKNKYKYIRTKKIEIIKKENPFFCQHKHLVLSRGIVSSSMENDVVYKCKDCDYTQIFHAKTPSFPNEISSTNLRKFIKECETI